MELDEALTHLLNKMQSYVKGASVQVFNLNEEARGAVVDLTNLLDKYAVTDLKQLEHRLYESQRFPPLV